AGLVGACATEPVGRAPSPPAGRFLSRRQRAGPVAARTAAGRPGKLAGALRISRAGRKSSADGGCRSLVVRCRTVVPEPALSRGCSQYLHADADAGDPVPPCLPAGDERRRLSPGA